MSRFFRGLALLSSLALIPAVAMSVVPSATDSISPDCAVFCPDGSMLFEGQIIGTDGHELGGELVRLIFNSNCTDMLECDGGAGTQPTTLELNSEANGAFTFAPEVGGCCLGVTGALECHAFPGDVTILPVYNHIASPDNGDTGGTSMSDLQVTTEDFVRFSQAFASTNRCMMLINDPNNPEQCTDLVTTEDFVTFSQKFAAVCP